MWMGVVCGKRAGGEEKQECPQKHISTHFSSIFSLLYVWPTFSTKELRAGYMISFTLFPHNIPLCVDRHGKFIITFQLHAPKIRGMGNAQSKIFPKVSFPEEFTFLYIHTHTKWDRWHIEKQEKVEIEMWTKMLASFYATHSLIVSKDLSLRVCVWGKGHIVAL